MPKEKQEQTVYTKATNKKQKGLKKNMSKRQNQCLKKYTYKFREKRPKARKTTKGLKTHEKSPEEEYLRKVRRTSPKKNRHKKL